MDYVAANKHLTNCQPGLCWYGMNECPVAHRAGRSGAQPVFVTLNVDTTIEQLASTLRTGLNYTELIDLIAELDAQLADSEFTKRLVALGNELEKNLNDE